jgi:hypothetical protein
VGGTDGGAHFGEFGRGGYPYRIREQSGFLAFLYAVILAETVPGFRRRGAAV